MTNAQRLFLIALLISLSAFFSVSEIALAASSKIKLRRSAKEGKAAAQKILETQENPGGYFTVVQIGLNAVAVLGGIVGESALTPFMAKAIGLVYAGPAAGRLAFLSSFAAVTVLFILFADLMPKRIALAHPERIAMAVYWPMKCFVVAFAPLVWFFNGTADLILKLLRIPSAKKDVITADDVMALADAGALAGGVLNQEQHLISNVFELDSRSVGSAMSSREAIVFLALGESDDVLRDKIAENPHGKYPVCEKEGIDSVIGYVDSKDLMRRIAKGKPFSLRNDPIVRKILVLPDTLNLFEALERFRDAKEDMAIIVNEYALVVGLLTLQDVMSTVMGELVSPLQEELIVRRDGASWLVDGGTPVDDVLLALGIDSLDGMEHYETMAGFLMYKLRRVPKRTDSVECSGYKFEVVDIDNYRIDQVLVTRTGEGGGGMP